MNTLSYCGTHAYLTSTAVGLKSYVITEDLKELGKVVSTTYLTQYML